MTSEDQVQKIHKKYYISFHTESSVRKRITVTWKGPGKDVLFGWEHRILLKESKVRMTNKPFYDNSAVSEWKGELYNANLYIDLHRFLQRIKVKKIFLNLYLYFLNYWHFCRWDADVPPGKTFQVAGIKEKRLYSQARGLSASVSFLSSPPLSRSFTSPISRAVFDSRKRLLRRLRAPKRRACSQLLVTQHSTGTDIVRTWVARQKRLRKRPSCPRSINDLLKSIKLCSPIWS